MTNPRPKRRSNNFSENTLSQSFSTYLAEQQGVLKGLTASLTPTLNAGPNQTGFSAPELASYNTAALQGVGANYANAARALNGQLAGRGGSSGLESGVDQQIKSTLASQAAGQTSNQELGITQQNYATGRANYNNAIAALGQVAGLESPVPFGTLTNNANSSAFSEANQIAAQNASGMNSLIGGITGLATGGFKALAGFSSPSSGGGASSLAALNYGNSNAASDAYDNMQVAPLSDELIPE